MKNLNQVNLPPLETAEMQEIKGGLAPAWIVSLAVRVAKEVMKSIPNGTPIY